MPVLSPSADTSETNVRPPAAARTECVDGIDSTLEQREQTARGGMVVGAYRKAVLAKLRGIKGGHITVVDDGQQHTFGDPAEDLHAVVHVRDWTFYKAVALGGSMGAGESYCDGHWTCNDLVSLIQIFARDLAASEELGGTWNAMLDWGRKVGHRLNRNTPSGSRRNIAAHYDLSNDFYRLFLDETMTYSSGVFPSNRSTMTEASVEKYDRICRKLQLKPGDQVLEIGTGWGGFAEHAVTRYGCRVTTTTISSQQHAYAEERFSKSRIDDRIELLLSDYRDLNGKYDKLVSIEMIEAVGHEYFEAFFAKCSDLLRPAGMMAIQAITIPDQRYDRYRKSVDFIQRYIFPGGCLPSLGAMTGAVGRATDLQFVHLEDFAEHYARTLKCWRQRFHQNHEPIRELFSDNEAAENGVRGNTEHFLRMWDYYLCYCEGAFREKQIGVAQLLLQKPDNRLDPQFPSLG